MTCSGFKMKQDYNHSFLCLHFSSPMSTLSLLNAAKFLTVTQNQLEKQSLSVGVPELDDWLSDVFFCFLFLVQMPFNDLKTMFVKNTLHLYLIFPILEIFWNRFPILETFFRSNLTIKVERTFSKKNSIFWCPFFGKIATFSDITKIKFFQKLKYFFGKNPEFCMRGFTVSIGFYGHVAIFWWWKIRKSELSGHRLMGSRTFSISKSSLKNVRLEGMILLLYYLSAEINECHQQLELARCLVLRKKYQLTRNRFPRLRNFSCRVMEIGSKDLADVQPLAKHNSCIQYFFCGSGHFDSLFVDCGISSQKPQRLALMLWERYSQIILRKATSFGFAHPNDFGLREYGPLVKICSCAPAHLQKIVHVVFF